MAKEGQLTDSAAPLVEEAQAQFDRIKSYLEARLKEIRETVIKKTPISRGLFYKLQR